MQAYEEYMKSIVGPMRQQLVENGFTELLTAEQVDNHMTNSKGISLIVINSVCGCAAGLARPAAIEAVNELEVKPEHLVTVFAGQDQEATYQLRSYLQDMPPSSPSMAIWKDGQLAYFIPREQIEGFPMEQVKDHIVQVLRQVTAS